jgi:tetratricopeptide (TPR) repeat protein
VIHARGKPVEWLQFPRRIVRSGYFWIFLAGLLLRGAYLADALARNELIRFPLVDAGVYVNWARDILAGKWLWYDVSNYTPGFPLWLAFWIGLLGWHPAAHFAVFHLLGAAQAVVLGKTAELVWERRIGIATGWLAAAYWPFIVFESTYYAEAFAIMNLVMALYPVVRWVRQGGGMGWLVWAGFHLGWLTLVRANAFVCSLVLAAWVVWHVARTGGGSGWALRRQATAAAAALLLPTLLMCAPIVMWNWKISGQATLRSEGWLSIYVGNNPDYGGLVVPAGVRWLDLVYEPVRAGVTLSRQKDSYWHDQVRKIVTERTGSWARLQVRKALMLAGRFEISQEIDIGIYRAAARVLSWPVWPGWGVVGPLAAVAIAAMCESKEARRGLPLAFCAAAYFASIFPVQVAARYRLPVVITLLPLAGWTLIWLFDSVRHREWHAAARGGAVLSMACLVAWPDWLGLRREQIINQWYLVGVKRYDEKDEAGALAAFEQGTLSNPSDPDCPLESGRIFLDEGEPAKARAAYEKSHNNFPRGPEAIIGLGNCALAENHPGEAMRHAAEALQVAPDDMDALDLGMRASMARGDWVAAAMICREMSSYPTGSASVLFSEALAWVHAGRQEEALRVYDDIAATRWFSAPERARAAYLGGVAAWHSTHDKAAAVKRWQLILHDDATFFTPLAELLTGAKAPKDALAEIPAGLQGISREYVVYAQGLAALFDGRTDEAQRCFESVLASRNAKRLAARDQYVTEIWSIEDLGVAK